VLLEVKNLSVFYQRVEAVRGVDLRVNEGELVAIIGANGAGKTSILNAISGIVPRQGEIWFKGERIDKLLPEQIAARGIIQVPEGRRLFPLLTVRDNLRMGAYRQKDGGKVAASLERVLNFYPVLKERFWQRAESLSGGEQQMLAIGRALMASPTLILMDEPSLGLSPLFCQKLEAQIAEINQAYMAIVLVEQNARMGLRLCSRGYVLETGNMILEGNSDDLRKNEGIKKAYLGV
jgi:branched-chain amino acid transport system ATP-binding protein